MHIIERLGHQLLDHGVVVADEMGLVVVVEGVLDLAHLVVREPDGHVRLRIVWLDRETLLVELDRRFEVSVEIKRVNG